MGLSRFANYPRALTDIFEGEPVMAWFWLMLAVAIAVVVGNALVLLRTARKPDIPGSVAPRPYRDDDEGGW
jgi:hypothetical protein